MHNRKSYFQNAIILFISVLPVFIISFFNHPLGDDYWMSALVRQHGFEESMILIRNTVSARYTALSLMSINPLVFGNFWLFKIVPLVYILTLIAAMYFLLAALLHNGSEKGRNKNAVVLAGAAFAITYIAVMPGIGEGLFWTSSLVVYQLSLLLFVLWAALLVRWYIHKNRSAWLFVAAQLNLVLIIGCNEIMAAIATLCVVMIALFHARVRRKVDLLSATMCLLAVPCWYYIIAAPSFGVRYGSGLSSGFQDWIVYLGKAFLYAGYHSFKSFINPFFWIGALVCSKYIGVMRLNPDLEIRFSRKTNFIILALSASSMVCIEFAAILLTDNHVAPLRITNIAIFVLLATLLVLGLGNSASLLAYRSRIVPNMRSEMIILGLLLAAGFTFKNNISVSAKELVNGKAYRYDLEMRNRYRLINSCGGDTCIIRPLKHRPVTLRYSQLDNDYHIGEYFQKQIVFHE
jgi:hypothetical protein